MNATSNKDKRSHYERLRKRTRSKGATGRQSRKRSHLDKLPWLPLPSPQTQTTNDLIEQTANNKLHVINSTGDSELSEDDLPSPTKANASTEKNVASEEDRRVAGKVDKNVSTEFDANNLILTI